MTDPSPLRSHLDALGLQIIPAVDGVLELDLDENNTGYLFENRTQVQVAIQESPKHGYVHQVGYDGRAFSQPTAAARERQGPGAGAPDIVRHNLVLRSSVAHDGHALKVYFTVAKSGSSETRECTIAVPHVTFLHPARDAADTEVVGAGSYHTPQARVFALAFDCDVVNQNFSVTYSGDADDQSQTQKGGQQSAVKLREGFFVPGLTELGPNSRSPEAADHTPGDGRVILVFDVDTFAPPSPVVILIRMEPVSVSSKVSSHYDMSYQVNFVDSGLGPARSPFRPADAVRK
jgi:hypothetical protein